MMKLIPAFLILLVLIILNAPIYLSILASAVYVTVFINGMPLQGMFTTIFEGITKNSLLAIPYFILAGNLISSGSLGDRLINSFSSFFRNIKGGMPIVCLISNAIFGAISGSPPAATAVFAKIIHKPIVESDGDKIATGLIVSSSGLSGIIPPSIAMIVFGVSTDTSISRLFTAGIIPGLLIIIVIATYLMIVGEKKVYKPFSWKEVIFNGKRGLPIFFLPILVLGGIYGGILTPTEAGALSAFYCFFISFFILKEIDFKKLLNISLESAVVSGKTYILIATSTFLARALTVSQLPQMLLRTFEGVSPIVFLLLLNCFLLLVGCFFDTAPAILVLAPMFLPVATTMGIDPIHLGIIFVINLTIGMFTPPFGLNIFIAQSILNKSTEEITKSLIPFIFLYLITLLLITFFPILSTFLPSFM